MTQWESFKALRIPASSNALIRPRFSLTSDILSFRRCSRQYSFFGNDGFIPAHTVQIYYGEIIHQVLDRAHRHYSGLMQGITKGTFPTDQDIENYFKEIETEFMAHGVRAINDAIREKALRVLKAFNRIEGPALYPRIFDTEYRLESDRINYVLRGIVDVLADTATCSPEKREIWDYKGSNRPPNSSPVLKDYIWQMCVYAELYKTKTGVYPAKAILYFVNELDSDSPLSKRPIRAVYEVNFSQEQVKDAMQDFDITAKDIIACKKSQQWPTPSTLPDEETCNICDVRWSCSVVRYSKRYPV